MVTQTGEGQFILSKCLKEAVVGGTIITWKSTNHTGTNTLSAIRHHVTKTYSEESWAHANSWADPKLLFLKAIAV